MLGGVSCDWVQISDFWYLGELSLASCQEIDDTGFRAFFSCGQAGAPLRLFVPSVF